MAHRYWEGAAIASRYAKYRPVSPPGLIKRIMGFLAEKYDGPLDLAYDVGCGSGQSTQLLANCGFAKVVGTDLSEAQVAQANKQNKSPNVSFKVSPGEVIPEPDNSVQLISTSQAAHWFDLPKFYNEGKRVLCPGGIMCLIGYELPRFVWTKDPSKEPLLDGALMDFFNGDLAHHVLPPSKEVYLGRYTMPKYRASFATDIVRDDTFTHEVNVSVEDMVMLTATWSGFNNFCQKNGEAAGEKLLDKYRNKLMDILNVPTSPEETVFTKRTPFFLLMARKP